MVIQHAKININWKNHMRHYLKSLIITIATFYFVYSYIPAIEIGQDPTNLPLVIGGFWVLSQIVNPIFSLILLPINLLTFGFFSLALNIAFAFALLKLLPDFSISAYHFPGLNIEGIILPPIAFSQTATVILIATTMTILQKVLHIIFE